MRKHKQIRINLDDELFAMFLRYIDDGSKTNLWDIKRKCGGYVLGLHPIVYWYINGGSDD